MNNWSEMSMEEISELIESYKRAESLTEAQIHEAFDLCEFLLVKINKYLDAIDNPVTVPIHYERII